MRGAGPADTLICRDRARAGRRHSAMGLSISQMARMSQLLDEALPLDEAGRRAWLERLSPEHEDLTAALRAALWPSQGQAADVDALSALPRLDSPDKDPAASGLQPGMHVGPYELIRLLGAGGMAEVWLARRADGALKREVALKLPLRTHLRADLEPRFARERDILASLEHPEIARLYDAGIDSQGLPYFAMEYVQGEPLTSWCDGRGLGIAERLGLLLQVLAAVQYAHEKHVIHRDLKPSNILVTAAGQVRLLDFGVAKLLEGDEADHTPLTSVYGRALTPDYASPELLRGERIDERSDLYSLGVLLYELLTGTRPYHLQSAASLGLIDQAIAHIDVKSPSSQRTQKAGETPSRTQERRARELRGDLDAIALKALAKDPAERYPSAAALAEDLQCYLDGRSIKARPSSPPDRLRKFVLRNKALVAVAASALVVVLASVGYTLYRGSRDQVTVRASALAMPAISNPARSIAVLPFLDMSEKHDQEYFADGMAEEIQNLLAKIPELKVIGRTSSFQFKGKTDDLQQISTALGTAYVVEGSVRRSGDHIRVTAELIDARDGTHRWSETYDRDIGDVLKVQGEVATNVVRALQLEVTNPLAASLRPSPRSNEAYDIYLRGLHAKEQFNQRGEEEAVADLRRALELDPSFVEAAEALATALANIAFAGYVPPKTGWEQARTAAQTVLELSSKSALGHALLGIVHVRYDWDWPAAAREFDDAMRLSPNLPIVVNYAAKNRMALGDWRGAEQLVSAANTLDPLDPGFEYGRGVLYLRMGRISDAEITFRRMLDISPTFEEGHFYLGTALLLEGKADVALPEMRMETRSARQLAGLALTYHALRRPADADAALARLEAEHANDSAMQIAQVYAYRSRKSQAFTWLERAYAQKDVNLWSIKGDPLLKNLEGDPRYGAFMRKMNLPE
jgi:eukaryotic-like serine/threonine-protein kinase